jgi:hypothetical protein
MKQFALREIPEPPVDLNVVEVGGEEEPETPLRKSKFPHRISTSSLQMPNLINKIL